MDTSRKVELAKEMKDTGDQAFKSGETKTALMHYHQALMYLLGLDKNAMNSMGVGAPATNGAKEEKTEADEIIEKIYANMSACHTKNQNWKRAVETADKALAKNPSNYKCMFRKGKALGEQGFFDKALKVLEELKTKNPDDVVLVEGEISRLRAMDVERERVNAKKLKGFLNKAAKKDESL